MRLDLKVGIISSGLRSYEVARELGWSPSKISAIISEVYDPTPAEKEAIAEVLGKSVTDIFPPKVIAYTRDLPSNQGMLA